MNSTTSSSQCLRILRHSCRTRKVQPVAFTTRFFITTPSRRQPRVIEPEPQVPDPAPYTAPPPIATPTVTANVTAAPPDQVQTEDSQPSSSRLPNVSTATMQQQIASSLSKPQNSLAMSMAKKLVNTSKSATQSYITYGVTEAFFKSCNAQADYTIPEDQRSRILVDKGPPKTATGEDLGQIESTDAWWFNDLNLEPTFSTWSQVSYLHMYLLTVRLRAMPSTSDFLNYQRYLIEHFSNAAEDKMLILHGLGARGIRNKYLKDLFIQWRGVLAAYDEGIARGDAVLAGAVWRNLWKGSEDVDWQKVAAVVLYMRRVLRLLAQMDVEKIVHNLDEGARVWKTAANGVMSMSSKPSTKSGQESRVG